MLNRCCPRQAFRSHAVPLMLLLLRRRAPACDRQVQAEGSMAARCAVTRCAGAFPMCLCVSGDGRTSASASTTCSGAQSLFWTPSCHAPKK
eukprot:scaffold5703_cov135-Isochrysis_galbana.AAC.5